MILALLLECREWLIQALDQLPPLLFFSIMSIAPALGAPVSPFFIISPGYGLGLALIGSIMAMTLNMALSYWLARSLFRPFIEKLIEKASYEIPQFSDKNQMRMAIIIRLTPGFPFCLQNYILGLSGMSFPIYLFISCLLNWPITIAFTMMGSSLFSGKIGTALIGIFLLVISVIIVKIIREKVTSK